MSNLLVIELHHLGDAVMALPFLRAATQRYTVSVLCTPSVAEMLEAFAPDVKAIRAASTWMGRMLQAATRLRGARYEVAVSAWSDSRAHYIGWLCGARTRVGFPMSPVNYYGWSVPWRKKKLRQGNQLEKLASTLGITLLTHPLNRASAKDSHLSNWSRIAASLDLPLSLATPWLKAEKSTPPSPDGSPLWVLHPGGRLPTKRWMYFQDLLDEPFLDQRVLIVQPPGHEAIPIPASPRHSVVAADTHQSLAAILNAADFVLCNDSYASHLAAALGKRTFTIFGSGEPAWFAPFGNSERVIQKDACPYHPCIDRCVMPSYVCLEAVKPADVTGAINQDAQ